MEKFVTIKPGETLAEKMFNNPEDFNGHIVVIGDEEFEKYIVRCKRPTRNNTGFNCMFKLKSKHGDLNLATTSHYCNIPGTSKYRIEHRVSELNLDAKTFIYERHKIKNHDVIIVSCESQTEME